MTVFARMEDGRPRPSRMDSSPNTDGRGRPSYVPINHTRKDLDEIESVSLRSHTP